MKSQITNCGNYLALLFTEFPEYEGKGYEEVANQLTKRYEYTPKLEDMVAVYTPFYEDSIQEMETDYFEGFTHG